MLPNPREAAQSKIGGAEVIGEPWACVHPKSGLLTAANLVTSPWLTPFELIEQMPWRAPRVKQWLSDHDAGLVEIKTRGKAVDPDQVQRQLRGKGSTSFTVFIIRFDRKVNALITRRVV